MPKFITADQSSAAWLKAREGRITASRMADVISYLKRGTNKDQESAKRYNYKMELIAERLTGMAVEHYVSPAMDHGMEWEGTARAAYEVVQDVLVDRVGFAVHPTMDFSGASPDALVEDRGVLEIKCPNTTTHLEWKMAGVVPPEHEPQMMWEMEVCERFWCDFVSFDPRLPEDVRLFIVRLDYDADRAKYLRFEVRKLNDEIEDAIARLRCGNLKEKLREAVANG